MGDTFFVREDDGTERVVTEETERVVLAASDRLFAAETIGDGTMKRVYMSDAEELAERQRWADSIVAEAERRTRTYQVFRRPTPSHAKTPVETPEIVVFGEPGDVFDASDLAQFRIDYGADRLEPLA